MADDKLWLSGWVGSTGRFCLGLYTLGSPLALLGLLIWLWPKAAGPPDTNSEQMLIGVLALLGALGGALHAASSFVDYVGNRQLVRSWTWWYLARAPIGACLALILYFVIRGGLLPSASGNGDGQLNIYGLAALAAMAGLCSEVATQKFREIFEAAFQPRGEKKDQLDRSVSLELLALEPNTAQVGSSDKEIVIKGKDLAEGDKVVVEGEEIPTTFVSAEELKATVPAAKLGTAAKLKVSVKRSGANPAQTNELELEVTAAPAE